MNELNNNLQNEKQLDDFEMERQQIKKKAILLAILSIFFMSLPTMMLIAKDAVLGTS